MCFEIMLFIIMIKNIFKQQIKYYSMFIIDLETRAKVLSLPMSLAYLRFVLKQYKRMSSFKLSLLTYEHLRVYY